MNKQNWERAPGRAEEYSADMKETINIHGWIDPMWQSCDWAKTKEEIALLFFFFFFFFLKKTSVNSVRKQFSLLLGARCCCFCVLLWLPPILLFVTLFLNASYSAHTGLYWCPHLRKSGNFWSENSPSKVGCAPICLQLSKSLPQGNVT